MKVKFTRVWSMPSKWTFEIKPIAHLINRYVGNGAGWVDPFAGENSPAEWTNDLNPSRPAKFHLHAADFVNEIKDKSFKGVLFDPPYSLRQVKECYDEVGVKMSFEDSKRFPNNIKGMISSSVTDWAICCGWNTVGFGKNLGFELIEVLLVCHGGRHNDTIVTVEKRFKKEMF